MKTLKILALLAVLAVACSKTDLVSRTIQDEPITTLTDPDTSLWWETGDTTNVVRGVKYTGTQASFNAIVSWAQYHNLPDTQLVWVSNKFKHVLATGGYGTVRSGNYIYFSVPVDADSCFVAQSETIFLNTYDLIP